MNWEKLDLHVENLIPGVVLLAEILIGWQTDLGALANHDALLAIAFVGAAYMSGAIANVSSRLLLDVVCRKTVRFYFMRLFLDHRIGIQNPSRQDVNLRYSAVITAGLSCGNERISIEVAKRRQTGRILRSSLIPIVLFVVILGTRQHWYLVWTVFAATAAYAGLLLLYAYAEVIVFQEGYRGESLIKQIEKMAETGSPATPKGIP